MIYWSINYLLLFTSVSFVNAGVQVFLTDSPLQRIGRRLYKEELLTNEFNDPKELAYDSGSRSLFFMYMDDDLQNSGRAFINVITKKSQKIPGISRNRATAVDTDSGDVYFGSDDGLYKYDPVTKEARNIGLYNVNILKLVVKNNNVYLIDANNHMLYKVLFDSYLTTVRLGEMKTVMEFDIDNENNLHYVAICGLYCITKDHEIVKNKDLSMVYNFLVDGDKTLGIKDGTIYDINCKNGTATKVSDLSFEPRSIVIGDYGDIYYSVENNIFRLKPISSYLVYNVHRKKINNTLTNNHI